MQSYKKRRYEPQQTFNSKFDAAIRIIINKFLETDSFNHSLTKGQEREKPIIEFLNKNLPQIFSICSGEVVDRYENSSPQLDVMIYDNNKTSHFMLEIIISCLQKLY